MAGAGRKGLWLRGAGAFMLVLSALVSCSVCFSLRGLGESLQHPGVDEATAAGEQRGKILFDGKDLELQGEPSSPAASLKLLKIILGQSSLSEDLEKENSANKEAAWKHLKPSLHCGQSEMEFRAAGHTAAALQLDIGAADPLPLNQVPPSCGYTMRKSALGFVLAVSYDGCNMIRENGNYVLKMSWLNASVEFICSVTSSSKVPDPYASKLSQEPEPLPVRTLRHRRDVPGQLYYDPSLYYYYYYYYYYACLNYYYNLYLMNLAHASSTQTVATAAPPLPTMTANPPKDDNQMPPYFPYYNMHYYQVGNRPVMAPQSYGSDPTNGPDQKPQSPQDPPGKTKWPFYPSAGPSQQGFPGSPLIQQVLQQYHGKKPYQPPPQKGSDVPCKPQTPTQQDPPPTSTTTAPATVTATSCPNQDRPISASCLGAVSSYVPYKNLTFRPYISYEGGKPADDQQKIPQTSLHMAGGVQPRAFPKFDTYASVPMSSAFLENPAVMNAWPYFFSYPHGYFVV